MKTKHCIKQCTLFYKISFFLIFSVFELSTVNTQVIGHWPLNGDFKDVSDNTYSGTVTKQDIEFKGAPIINCSNVPLGTNGQLTVAVWGQLNRIKQAFAGFIQKQNTEYEERSFGWVNTQMMAFLHGLNLHLQ